MEGVLPKVRCQIFCDFYGKNVTKSKTFTIGHFKKMECKKKTSFFHVMQLVDAEESVPQKESRVS